MTVQSSGEAGPRAAGQRPPAGRMVSIPGNQDARAVKDLRLGVGVIGALLPIMLIAWNWIARRQIDQFWVLLPAIDHA
jgi:hypothetical protein